MQNILVTEETFTSIAFMPLLEEFLNKTYRASDRPIENSTLSDVNIAFGIDNYRGFEEYILISEVSDIFKIDPNELPNAIVICTLATHWREIDKLGLPIYLITKDEKHLTLPTESRNWWKGDERVSDYVINPTSFEGFPTNAIILYRENAYQWDENNYADEYSAAHQVAFHAGIPLVTATTEAELEYYKKIYSTEAKEAPDKGIDDDLVASLVLPVIAKITDQIDQLLDLVLKLENPKEVVKGFHEIKDSVKSLGSTERNTVNKLTSTRA